MTLGSRGFSLVQVLVATGIMGGLALVLMRLQDNSSQITKTAEVNQALYIFSQEITSVLTIPKNCTETFKTLVLNETPRNITVIKKVKNNGTPIVMYTVGNTYQNNQLKLESIQYVESSDEFLEVRMKFNKESKQVAGGKSISKVLKLSFSKDAMNRITQCGGTTQAGGLSIISSEEPGMAGKTGHEACEEKGKTCGQVMSYNYIKEENKCGLHCVRVCATWYNQSLPGVVNGASDGRDNLHSCDARLGDYTTYLEPGKLRCNAFFAAVCN